MHLITVIQDIHVGHPGAVWPDGFESKSGNVIDLNSVQEYLLTCWNNFFSQPEVKRSKYVLNLAESIEGNNRKEMGVGLMTADINAQVKAFAELLSPHLKDKTYISVSGSEYHGLQGWKIEELVTKHIKELQPKCNVHFAGDLMRWVHKPTGYKFFLVHKIGNAIQYKVSQMDKWSLYMSAIKNYIDYDPDFILTAHNHQFFQETTKSRIIVQGPCWKMWHPIIDASRYVYTQPSIGGYVIALESNKRKQVIPFLYPIKHLFDKVAEL